MISFKVSNTREILRSLRVEVENNKRSDLELESFQLFGNRIDSSLQPFISAKFGLKHNMKIPMTRKEDGQEV